MELSTEHRLTEVEQRSKSNTKRLDDMERRQDNLEGMQNSLNLLSDREKRVEEDVKEIKTDVKELTNKPAKRWDSLVSQIITLLVAAVVGFLLAKIGL